MKIISPIIRPLVLTALMLTNFVASTFAQEVFIPERKVVKFKPGKVMEDKITTPSMKGGIQPAPARKRENASEPPRVSGEGSLS